jgi:hypothetical protein
VYHHSYYIINEEKVRIGRNKNSIVIRLGFGELVFLCYQLIHWVGETEENAMPLHCRLPL